MQNTVVEVGGGVIEMAACEKMTYDFRGKKEKEKGEREKGENCINRVEGLRISSSGL